jgi:hypothetical protein
MKIETATPRDSFRGALLLCKTHSFKSAKLRRENTRNFDDYALLRGQLQVSGEF